MRLTVMPGFTPGIHVLRLSVMPAHCRPKDGVLSHAYVAGIHVLASTSLLAAEDVTHDPPSGCRAGYGGREKRTLTTP